MKHAREDYNRIQDPENKIPEDEPVFLLRAQDVTAPDVVEHWASRAHHYGAMSNIVDAARGQASAMREWQREHGMKIPDMPKVVDMSDKGQQLKTLIQKWLCTMMEASVYSDLSVGRHVIKEIGGTAYYFFKSTPLLDYLRKEWHWITHEYLWEFVSGCGGKKHRIRVKTPKGSMPVDLWGIPINAMDIGL